jgi:hypothetical protein
VATHARGYLQAGALVLCHKEILGLVV